MNSIGEEYQGNIHHKEARDFAFSVCVDFQRLNFNGVKNVKVKEKRHIRRGKDHGEEDEDKDEEEEEEEKEKRRR
jgi:hypothetical protein